MIRKIAAYCFILIANIILFAHAVIPHHHHQMQVCIEREHCINDSIQHNHNQSEHNHQHDSNNNPGSCFLAQLAPVPADIKYRLSNCQHFGNKHFQNTQFVYISGSAGILIPLTTVNTFIPDFIPTYSALDHLSSGSRAPPMD